MRAALKTAKRKLKDKKFPRAARRYTYQWLAEAENFTLIYAALDTAYRAFRSQAHHASMGGGMAPGRVAAKKLQRRYGNIMLHLREILKA